MTTPVAEKRPKASGVLLAGSTASLLTNLIDLLFSLLILPLLVATLGKEHYGIWTLVGQTVGFLVLSNLGVSNAVGRFVARARAVEDSGDLRAVVSTSILMLAISGGLVLAASLLIVQPLWRSCARRTCLARWSGWQCGARPQVWQHYCRHPAQ